MGEKYKEIIFSSSSRWLRSIKRVDDFVEIDNVIMKKIGDNYFHLL